MNGYNIYYVVIFFLVVGFLEFIEEHLCYGYKGVSYDWHSIKYVQNGLLNSRKNREKEINKKRQKNGRQRKLNVFKDFTLSTG
jgi:hypothetical protein